MEEKSMKFRTLLIVMLLTLVVAGSAFPQAGRRSQIEAFGGVALPMAPDYFKDWYKMGYSVHGQYVLFPSSRLGISIGVGYEPFIVDEDGFIEEATGFTKDEWSQIGYDISLDITLSILELCLGIRPYLTPPEANMQFFIFGMGTYNFINSSASFSISDGFDTVSGSDDVTENRFGVAAGGGFEIPIGDSMNIIVQALYRFIFVDELTSGETISFLGITGGVAF